MKLLLLIIALTCHQFVSAQIGGYSLVDPQEVNSDQSIQDALTFGARYVIAQGIQDNLPNSDYEVSGIYSVYRQVVSGLNYKFDVELRNSEATRVRATYVVYVQSWTNTREVSSYGYNIEDNGTAEGEFGEFTFLPEEVYVSDEEENLGVPGGWSEVDLSDIENDSQIQDLLNYGVQFITEQEALAQKLPDAEYEVDQIHSVYKQVVSGINYQFDVDIRNNLGWALRATFIVYSQPWNNRRDVTSYVYQVTANPNISEEEEEFAPPDEEDIVGGYSEIDPSELDTNQQLSDALNYGIKAVTDQAVDDHNLPYSNYEVVEFHSIYEQVVSGMNYRFDVSLRNCAGLVARAVFTVYSQVWTNTLEATPISLEVTGIPKQGLIGGDCPSDETGYNEEEPTLDEEWRYQEGEGDIVGGFSPINLDEANNNPQIQELLNFGAQYVIGEGIKAHRIPNSKYEVSKVFSVESQVVSGLNYRYDVELRNCQGLTVRANYIVYYQSWTNTRGVSEYSFDITAAPNGLGACPVEEEEDEENRELQGNGGDPLPGGWIVIPLDEANSDSVLQNALAVGIKQFIERGIQDGNLPNQEYEQNELLSAEKQVVNGINYRFDVNLSGNEGARVRARLVVYTQPRSNIVQLSSYTIVSVN